uniref:CLTH domain-containing protein n=1 Tax=Echinostoma caproni TaxID=27848 RepID=A0A183AHM1_9TREM
LIAYQDPYSSPFRRFLDPSHRDRLADAVNSAIMVHLNQPANPILDSALAFLERSLTEDDSALVGVRAVHFGAVGSTSQAARLRSGSDRGVYSAPARSEVAPGMNEVSQSRIGPPDFTTRHRLTSYSDRLASPESPMRLEANSFRQSGPYSTLTEITHPSSFGVSSPFTDTELNQGNSPQSSNTNHNNSASIVASSIYIHPSALVSLSSHPRQSDSITEPARSLPSSSLTAAAAQAASRLLTTSLRHALDSHRLNQSRTRHSASSSPPFAYTGSTSTVNVAGWPSTPGDHQPAQELPTSPQQHHQSVPSAAVRLAVASYLADTHAPTGPELAGFFHPLLFID